MINIAIIEDNPTYSKQIEYFINEYSSSNNIDLEYHVFSSGDKFLSNFKNQFDIIFMDIDFPGRNGYETAKIIREKDEDVIIIFLTLLNSYAIKGYEVDALDYLLKPVCYDVWKAKMDKALNKCNRDDFFVKININRSIQKINANCIKYITVENHSLTYVCEDRDIISYGTLKEAMNGLPDKKFFRCNNSYIINLDYVVEVAGNHLFINDIDIPISRKKKKEFIKALNLNY